MLDTGTPAPAFELPNHASEPVSLKSYGGHYVVVYFYPRADTEGCTTEACGFRDRWGVYSDRDVVILGISDDPVEDLAAFREKYDLPFQLLSDESGAVASSYDSYGEKNMFGRTFDGVFRNTYLVDPDGIIVEAFEGVTPEGHADEVLDALPA